MNQLLRNSFRYTSIIESGRAGSQIRLNRGSTRSGNEYGSALFALPDWEYADGRPAPVRASVRRAILRNERTQQRIERLRSEVDQMIADKLNSTPSPQDASSTHSHSHSHSHSH